jgi:hypothetical protein
MQFISKNQKLKNCICILYTNSFRLRISTPYVVIELKLILITTFLVCIYGLYSCTARIGLLLVLKYIHIAG